MSNPLALIIEDDKDLATIFTAALKIAQFETETITDGRDALARLAEVTPTVIILDLHLPYVSGQDILLRLRADQRLAKTRVILASADALMAESLRAEADLVLLKPVSFEQLSMLAARLRPKEGEIT
jgi:DNA-binding response OmpR family regulator